MEAIPGLAEDEKEKWVANEKEKWIDSQLAACKTAAEKAVEDRIKNLEAQIEKANENQIAANTDALKQVKQELETAQGEATKEKQRADGLEAEVRELKEKLDRIRAQFA